MLRIEILGSLQVTVGVHSPQFRTDALRVLLAYLAAQQGTPIRRDTLAGLLSPDRPNKEALTYLRNRLTRLRKAIGDDKANPPYFTIDRKQIALRHGDDISIDVTRFDRLIDTVEAHAHRQLAGCPTCLAHLREAVALVRGELLAGLNFPSDTWQSWLLAQREHYQQRALETLTLLREALLVQGAWEEVVAVAQRQLSAEPWLEPAHRAIMQAHYQLGDRTAALAQYERCEKVLWEELGVDPEEETLELCERIKGGGELTANSYELTAISDNLPLQMGAFFGRKTEQTQLLNRLVDPNYRLITLVGAGGIGKTRLSIEVGKQVKLSFPDGVWFVPLGAVQGGAEQIKIAVGEAAGLGNDEKQLTGDQVLAILRDKQMLLIFDNSEIVLDEIAFIPEWLRRAPGIVILASSREPLNFQAESVVYLQGLPTSESEQMFAERGRMARGDFMVSAETLPQIRHICHLVDGSPLGIALAAAWVRRRSLQQISDSISQSLDFLSTRLRDIDPRHRSMRAVFETSWQMLEAEEQEVLAALSVFPTSFSADAATKIANATLFDLDILCEKSLLQQQHESERYQMHSLVRQFSAEKLADRSVTVDHAFVEYFYQLAEAEQNNYEQLQPEWRNFSTGIAKAHALAGWQTVLDYVQALNDAWFRQIRFSDMREGLTFALDAATELGDKATLAEILLRLGEIEVEQNDYVSAEKSITAALQQFMRLEDSTNIAHTKYVMARINLELSRHDETRMLATDSKQIFQDERHPLGVAQNLTLLALCAIQQDADFEAAQRLLQQSAELQRAHPPTASLIETLRYLGRATMMLQDVATAEACLLEAAQLSRQQNNLGEYAAVTFERVLLCKKLNQVEQALTLGYECLDTFKKLGSLRWEALIKTQLGLMHQAKNQLAEGRNLMRQSLQIFDELGDKYEQAYAYYYLSRLHQALGETEASAQAQRQAYRLSTDLQIPLLMQWLEEATDPS